MIACTFEDGNPASLRHVVVDTLVFKDDQILMVKRVVKLLEGGKWGIIGGFAEHDETLIQAVQREVMEETGWQIRDIKLLAINDHPNRPGEDRQNISFVYVCQATKKTGEPDWESDEQRWFDLDNLPPREVIAFDHADYIDLYRRYMADKPALPMPF